MIPLLYYKTLDILKALKHLLSNLIPVITVKKLPGLESLLYTHVRT